MGSLYVVATPIGNLKDMSPRAIEILNLVDLIAAEDTRQTMKLLKHFNIKTRLTSYHKFNEFKKSDQLITALKTKNINIALVSDAGTPCISDPGHILVTKAREANLNIYGISGPSALTTALSISGLKTDVFAFYGFLPTSNKERKKIIKELKALPLNTIVLYESPKRIIKLAELIEEEFPHSKVCFCSDLTKLHEKSIYGDITAVLNILKQDPKVELGEYTVILQKENSAKKGIDTAAVVIESLLVETAKKNNCSLKNAIAILKTTHPHLKRKDIYNAFLNLKKLIT